MYSSNQHDYEKFSASPAPTASPPTFSQTAPAVGYPASPMNQFYPQNSQLEPGVTAPWSSGLCDCTSDVPNCCITCWCPCITFGQISEIVDKGSSSCVANGAIYTLLMYMTGCACLYSCCYRSKLRHQFNLKDEPCGDCLLHCCCESCALCQEYRELTNRGFDMSIGWQGNVERQNRGVAMPPVVQGGMSR